MKHLCALATLLPALAGAGTWSYSEYEDRMTGKPISVASLTSDNKLDLQFPYSGENRGELMVRRHPKHGTHVIVHIDKGQILCNTVTVCKVSVKFGDKPPRTFRGVGPDDHGTTSVALGPAADFIEAAKGAGKILIQVPIYQAGSPILEFSSPVGLQWASLKKR